MEIENFSVKGVRPHVWEHESKVANWSARWWDSKSYIEAEVGSSWFLKSEIKSICEDARDYEIRCVQDTKIFNEKINFKQFNMNENFYLVLSNKRTVLFQWFLSFLWQNLIFRIVNRVKIFGVSWLWLHSFKFLTGGMRRKSEAFLQKKIKLIYEFNPVSCLSRFKNIIKVRLPQHWRKFKMVNIFSGLSAIFPNK